MGSGVLLAFPLHSVALRLAVALGVALVLLRVFSGAQLRSPRARVLLAVSPFVVAGAVLLVSIRDLALPAVLRPTTAQAGAIALPVADRYLDFAPTGPIIVGVWGTVAALLIARRLVRSLRFRASALAVARTAPPRVAVLVVRLARDFAVTPPRALVVDGGITGAAVLGLRDPVLLLDASALEALDEAELEGVIAHELAHIARRDNLVAWTVAVVRDLVHFIPGAGSALRALHREREAAADQDAVEITGRPGALASGLLTVAELGAARSVPQGCAALVPTSGVVERVRILVDEERPSPERHRLEVLLAGAVSLIAVVAAVLVPGLLSGPDGQRDALGVLVGTALHRAAGGDQALDAAVEGRVFDVYRRLSDERALAAPSATTIARPELLGPEDRPGVAQLCADGGLTCPVPAHHEGLRLRPAPIVLLEDRVGARWQATPVLDGSTGDRLAVYWLARLDSLASSRS